MVNHFFRISRRCFFLLSASLLLMIAIHAKWTRPLQIATTAGTVEDRYVFVLDAGHGGEDGGATTADGISESSINLSLTRRLDDLLHLLGHDTVLVRNTDTALYSEGCSTYAEKKVSDLHNRASLVNQTPHAFLVSIHQNHFPQSKYSGAQLFYNHISPAQKIAEGLQAQLAASLDPANHRQAKSAVDTVFLLREICAPGILVECGFLSNSEEAEKLQQPAYQTKLAMVIACTLDQLVPKEILENEI